ncbi:thioredoxin fold domain-containing protein [Planctomicrobium sp. SH661]|uniref:thioredoxin fold domain-containing protein n=1 Tax=Planctomicrobium sp. SH661 TaxID=3448124 RepID=UPI003F5B2A97
MSLHRKHQDPPRVGRFASQGPVFRSGTMLFLGWGAAMLSSPGTGFAESELKPAQAAETVKTNEATPASSKSESETESKLHWVTDIEEAKKTALAENKGLLLFFTGSDWCGFCIKLEKEVFHTPEFEKWIADKYVPVVLDFPRGKQLADALKEQNEKLKNAFQINGYPTVYTVDVELFPHGRIVGFGGTKQFWNGVEQATEQAGRIREITGGVAISSISDPVVLDKLLTTVPEDQLRYGWIPELERIIAATGENNHPELKDKWSEKLVAINNIILDEKIVSAAIRTYQQKKRSGAEPQEILEFLNAGIADANGRKVQLRHFLSTKATFLREQKDFVESLAVVDEILAADWANDRDRATARTLQQRLFLNLGRFDEGIAIIKEAGAEREYPSDQEREFQTKYQIAQELNQAGQYIEALKYWREIFEKPGSNLPRAAYTHADTAANQSGTDLGFRAEVLLAWSQASEGQRQKDTKYEKASLAAVAFAALGQPDRIKEATALVDLDDAAEAAANPSRRRREAPLLEPGQIIPLAGIETPNSPPVVRTGASLADAPHVILKAAAGSKGEAYEYLAKQSHSIGRAVYLLEAAFAYRQENQQTKADELAGEAAQIASSLDPKLPDRAGVGYLEELLARWTSEKNTASNVSSGVN